MSKPECGCVHATSKRIEELEAELKWLQREHVKICSSESKLRDSAQALVDNVRRGTPIDITAVENQSALADALAALLEGQADG